MNLKLKSLVVLTSVIASASIATLGGFAAGPQGGADAQTDSAIFNQDVDDVQIITLDAETQYRLIPLQYIPFRVSSDLKDKVLPVDPASKIVRVRPNTPIIIKLNNENVKTYNIVMENLGIDVSDYCACKFESVSPSTNVNLTIVGKNYLTSEKNYALDAASIEQLNITGNKYSSLNLSGKKEGINTKFTIDKVNVITNGQKCAPSSK